MMLNLFLMINTGRTRLSLQPHFSGYLLFCKQIAMVLLKILPYTAQKLQPVDNVLLASLNTNVAYICIKLDSVLFCQIEVFSVICVITLLYSVRRNV